MRVTQITGRNRQAESTVVRVEDVCHEQDDAILALAMSQANETPSSLFGTLVTRYDDGIVVVTLHTD